MLEHLYHKQPLSVDLYFDELRKQRDAIAPMWATHSNSSARLKKMAPEFWLEGQLGAMKDPDFGIYPMVTSSSTLQPLAPLAQVCRLMPLRISFAW